MLSGGKSGGDGTAGRKSWEKRKPFANNMLVLEGGAGTEGKKRGRYHEEKNTRRKEKIKRRMSGWGGDERDVLS